MERSTPGGEEHFGRGLSPVRPIEHRDGPVQAFNVIGLVLPAAVEDAGIVGEVLPAPPRQVRHHVDVVGGDTHLDQTRWNVLEG